MSSMKQSAAVNFLASILAFGAVAFSSLVGQVDAKHMLVALGFGNMTGVAGLYSLLLAIEQKTSEGDK